MISGILVSIKSNSAKKVDNNWKFHGVVVRKAFFFRLLRAKGIRHKHMCDENCQLKKGKNGRKLLRLKTKRSQTENEGAPAAKQTRGELHACQTQISRYPEDY